MGEYTEEKSLIPLRKQDGGSSIIRPIMMLISFKYLALSRFCSKFASKEFKTTLATRSYINLVRRAQEKGHVVHLLFFWLDSIELAKRRVADRVASGGHNIPLPVIERRYKAGLKNLFEIFMKEVDIWILFDNSLNKGERVAFGGRQLPTKIKDIVKFNIIKDYE